jgi:Transposase DDE domain
VAGAMSTNYLYTDMWPYVSRFLPDVEESARQCGALKRSRNVPNGEALIRMGMAYAVSDLSFKDVAAWARALEIARISGPGLHYRIKTSEAWFEKLLTRVLDEEVQSEPVGFRARLVDATVITGPGSVGTDWRAHVSLDPDTGRIISVELTDAKGGENFSRFTFEKGEIVLGDQGYTSPRGIYSVVSSGAHLLFRLNPYSLRVCDTEKQKISLLSYIETVRGDEIKEWDVLVPIPPDDAKKSWSSHKAKAWVRARVLAFRTQKGEVIWLLTDLDSESLSKEAAKKLFRVRWQIELLFKRLKSLLHLDRLPTRKGPTAKSWLLLRFLAAALSQRLLGPTERFSP